MRDNASKRTAVVTAALCTLCVGFVFVGAGCPAPTTPCTSDTDCAESLVCDTATGLCVEPPGCGSDVDCPDGEVCDTATGLCGPPDVPEGCTSDAECDEGEFCDVVTGECVVNADLYDTTRFDTDKDAVHMTPSGHTTCTVCHHAADGETPNAAAQPCVPCHSDDPDNPTSFKWAAHDLDGDGNGCRSCHETQFSSDCAYCHPLLDDL